MKSKLRLLSVLVAGTFGTAFVQAEENSVQPRIIGGAEVAHSSVPYQVALQTPSGFQFCGGTIIARDWVLTAAHCVQGKSASGVQIRIGVADLRTSQGEKHNVSRVITHERYNSSNLTNDIALLKLSTPVDAKYQIAKLPTPAIKAQLASPGDTLKASGWGRFSGSSNQGSSILKAADLPVGDCQQITGRPVSSDFICGYKPRNSVCNGDSGGPFATQHGNEYYVFGAASWVPDRSCSGVSAFTDVTKFVPWISQKSGITPDGGGTTPPPTDACSGVAAWELYKQYNQGDRAVANGTLFEANYRHYGVNPFSDYWGYWTMVQTCN
ncbi:S1 family peptidase [Vibrio nigripulchritudo]|uniref:S1 family peptidase n=1 Tax=Vibrio nigripulchritudo TaxID=28173 RepID=UPI0003B1E02C|nr:serine protease [Vibrio nigripulchritudo]CCN71779.1 putative Peptidase S1 and S6, chymotrypsin/Hap [Vibrio nigripulchritudo SFn118]